MSAPRLILASASPRRRELLGLLAYPFEVVPSAFDEVLPEWSDSPERVAEELAVAKALEVARRHPDALVIGADTIVARDGRLFGKPESPADAERMLQELSGGDHVVATGVAILRDGGAVRRSFASQTVVRFRTLTAPEIRAYVASGEPMDKAGAYAIQGFGALLIEGIVGDFPNVVGLPITELALRLREFGVGALE